MFAGPAVGAPSIAGRVVEEIKHGICLVGGDICTSGDARRFGLAPCPLRSETKGGEGSVSVLFAEVGGKWVLTVTPLSDGTVSVVRTAGVSSGLTAGAFGGNLGPLRLEGGPEGTVRARIQGAAGWLFADQATAARFLAHAVRNGADFKRWPSTWQSGELGSEVAASVGVTAGLEGRGGAPLAGASAAAQMAVGAKRSRDGSLTTYSRMTLDRGEVSVPFMAPVASAGRKDWIVEFTRSRDGRPRELVLRDATIALGGKQVTETVGRLDLRDAANLVVAESLIDSAAAWTMPGGAAKQAVVKRIASHGIVERSISAVEDRSRGASVSIKLGVKLGLSGKRVHVLRRLVSATASAGVLDGRRLDCLPP